MSDHIFTLLLIGVYLGMFSTIIMRIILDKIEDVKRKKRLKDKQRRIKDGTFVGAPYYSGLSASSLTPLDLKKLQNNQ